MPEENGGNGAKKTGLLDKLQEDAKALKQVLYVDVQAPHLPIVVNRHV